MFNNILIVCVGNICRSPTAEALFKQKFPTKQIRSCGLSASIGHPADKNAMTIARHHQINLESHQAQQINEQLCSQADIILVMEKEHSDLITNSNIILKGKTFLLGHWLNNKEIPDPYKQDIEAFEFVFQLIDEAVTSWSDKI